MTARLAVVGMALLLGLYLLFALRYGVLLIGVGQPVAIGLGIALLVLPVLAGWAIAAEIVFAARAGRLGRRLEAEGGLPTEELPLLPSGRIDPTAADAVFPRYRAETEQSPEDWRTWYRLGLAYAASGDRRRSRWATRQAIRLARSTSA